MHSFSNLVVSAAVLAAGANAAFNAAAKNNVVAYWGQGPNQDRLLAYCQNPNIDIINIGFINVFPDQGPGGWPGDNFGNACWAGNYNNTKGQPTDLLMTCPNIPGDVVACQQTYGKKIFLSLGGGANPKYYINNTKSAQNFAQFLWSAFGPVSASRSDVPRPWGNASVDGFDLDIESYISPAPFKGYESNGYADMANYFKNTLFPQDKSKAYYLSMAPQCILPDVHLSTALATAWFDFVWIQFYNTASCSARAGVNHINGKGTTDISFDAWCGASTKNPNVKMYLGLPGNTNAATAPPGNWYITPPEAYQLTQRFYSAKKKFGGIMVYDATYGTRNVICNQPYLTWMKRVLNAVAAGKALNPNPKTCQATSKRGETSLRSHARDFVNWLGFEME